jgi:hypothetical protein
MMTTETLTSEEIRRRGLEALRRELGLVGMIRFLQLFETGKGNYTEERHQWLDQLTMDDILADIRKRRQAMQQEADAQNL